MITNAGDIQPHVERLRAETDRILQLTQMPDTNGLMADLAATGYLNATILGNAGAVVARSGPEVELFANDMPTVAEAAAKALHAYTSIHERIYWVADRLQGGSDRRNTVSGYVIDVMDGRMPDGRYFLAKDTSKLAELRGETAVVERGLDGVVGSRDVVASRYRDNQSVGNIYHAIRIAGQWGAYLHKPPFDHQTGESYERVLTREEAQACIKRSLELFRRAGKGSADIDILRDVIGRP